MYLKLGEEFLDGELRLLEELLALLDSKLLPIHEDIARSNDPESDGLLDRGEYLIGVGFCITQQYLVDTLTLTGVNKSEAFDLGPRTSSGASAISAVNAAANWWKHSAEWVGADSVPAPARRTVDVVEGLSARNTDYALSNVLAALVGSEDFSLSALVPCLTAWRAAVHERRASQTP